MKLKRLSYLSGVLASLFLCSTAVQASGYWYCQIKKPSTSQISQINSLLQDEYGGKIVSDEADNFGDRNNTKNINPFVFAWEEDESDNVKRIITVRNGVLNLKTYANLISFEKSYCRASKLGDSVYDRKPAIDAWTMTKDANAGNFRSAFENWTLKVTRDSGTSFRGLAKVFTYNVVCENVVTRKAEDSLSNLYECGQRKASSLELVE